MISFACDQGGGWGRTICFGMKKKPQNNVGVSLWRKEQNKSRHANGEGLESGQGKKKEKRKLIDNRERENIIKKNGTKYEKAGNEGDSRQQLAGFFFLFLLALHSIRLWFFIQSPFYFSLHPTDVLCLISLSCSCCQWKWMLDHGN